MTAKTAANGNRMRSSETDEPPELPKHAPERSRSLFTIPIAHSRPERAAAARQTANSTVGRLRSKYPKRCRCPCSAIFLPKKRQRRFARPPVPGPNYAFSGDGVARKSRSVLVDTLRFVDLANQTVSPQELSFCDLDGVRAACSKLLINIGAGFSRLQALSGFRHSRPRDRKPKRAS